MARQYRATVLFSSADIGSVIDMLRYEGCRVTGWAPGSQNSRNLMTYVVDLMGDRPFTKGRWDSFGLTLIEEA
jgi:hypothetical protein